MIVHRRHRTHRRQLLPTYHQMIITVAVIITAIATMIMSIEVNKSTIHAINLSSISIWDTCWSAFSNSTASTSITLSQVFACKRQVKPIVRRVSSTRRNSFAISVVAIEQRTICALWTRSMTVRRRSKRVILYATVRLFSSPQRTISVKHRGRRPNSIWHFVKRSTSCCKVCRIRTPRWTMHPRMLAAQRPVEGPFSFVL